MTIAARLIPIEDVRALWLQAQRELTAQGFTSIREPQVPTEIMRLYWSLRREGQLTMRVSMGIDVGAGQAEELDDILRPWGVGPGFGDHWLRFDSLGEFAVDGSGLIDSTPALFRRGILTIHRHGWRPAPHIGSEDKYLDQALEAYEAADRERPIRDERWIVEHVPQTRPDQMDRLARLGVTAVMNLAGYRETGTLIKTYGQARAERIVPVREMLDHRVNVVFGSDWSDGPNNPFVPFYYYTTRKTEEGAVLGPAQAISRPEALRLLTVNPAYLTFEETLKGSIEPGKLADFVILSQDVLTVADDRIRATQALETYVGGRRVFAK
jgi:predicted amidohydrolase YtcJ